MINYTIIDKFINTARKNADKPCLVIENKEYSYLDLDEMSNALAHRIDDVFNAIGLPILVFAERPFQIACSVIGVMKSRNIVVPVSVKTPLSRILEIIDTCGIKGYIALNKKLELNIPHISAVYERESSYRYAGVPSDNAYIIYTSGTTGKSKGVLVGHKGLVNSIMERNSILGINRESNSINLVGVPFDGFLMSFFSPLIAGAVLYLPNSISDYKEICGIIREHSVSMFLCTPTFLRSMLLNVEDGLLDKIKLISLAGESISPSLVEKLTALYPHIQIANEYGPTENSICTSINPDIRGQKMISAGRVIQNVEARINGSGPCEKSEIGELLLSGVGLAQGYVNDEKLTNEKFVRCGDETWYHTGDLACWHNNELVIVGREDRQIKVNGYRVDLSEVENTLRRYRGVDDCTVIYDGNKGMTAYIVSSEIIPQRKIVGFLSEYLAAYMVPVKYIHVKTIPMKDSGKIDIAALCEEGNKFVLGNGNYENEYSITPIICGIYKEILKLDKCDNNDNFFLCGGNSLNADILREKINERFNCNIETEDIRIYPTPILLAERISNLVEDNGRVTIKPFNKFWFIDCYFTSILSVLEYHFVPIAPFIRSFAIHGVKVNGSYYLNYDYNTPLSDILGNLGMMYDPGILDNDFEAKILGHVTRDRVVMLHVDCFYLPYCKEKYQKEHFEHVIALVGYDCYGKVFDVIDQESLESVSFIHHKADIDSVRDAAYAEIVNRETFDNADFVAVYPLPRSDPQNNQMRMMEASQLDYVVENTIAYLKEKPNETIVVLQRLINYLRVEKEVFRFLNDENKLMLLKRKEVQLLRYLMMAVNRDENSDGLIRILTGWEKFG